MDFKEPHLDDLMHRFIPFWFDTEIRIQSLKEEYQNSKPFKNLVIDSFFVEPLFNLVSISFPEPDQTKWWNYDNPLEKKLAKDQIKDVNKMIRFLINELMENRFVSFLEKITGIEGLITDHTLNGGGLHQIVRGGKLDIHADYNYHPITRLDRRLNVLIYLNKNWKSEWKGNLEFWDSEMKACQKSIEPIYNRLVIFETNDHSYHGHPDPLQCPDHITRKSIALYYYTNGRPEHEKSSPHSTLYQKRPQDPNNPEIDELRKKRSIKRIEN